MKIHTVKGAAGVNLHVREFGKSTGIPILLNSWMVTKPPLLVKAI